ncbi:MAG: flagellar hook capping FlgD N-terminal domain-containing protein [Bryobacteraceae bacterium]
MSTISATNSTAQSQSQTAAAAAASSVDPSGTSQLANENTFLQLLVAQMQNQDPMNPQDSSQFLTQLAQFSQVEQLIGIHSDTQALVNASTGTTQNSPAQPSTGATKNP